MIRSVFVKFFAGFGAAAILVLAVVFSVFETRGTENVEDSAVSFVVRNVEPEFFLDGAGVNVDSPEFFEAENPEDTLLFVSGKSNDMVEIWKFPFQNNQLAPLERNSMPNGLDIDQDKNLLLVGDAQKRIVETFSIPNLSSVLVIGDDIIENGETNLDTLTFQDGKKNVYVSENHKLNIFDLETGSYISSFSPNVESIEEVLADNFHQIIYVPDENGVKSKINPGGAVAAHYPNGEKYLKNGSNLFGQGLFTGDEEGIALYACKGADGADNGHGIIIVANQSLSPRNSFEFFDRVTWSHLGSVSIVGVSGTDGIAVSEKPLPNYPQGFFAVSNDDKNVALVSWEKIFFATNFKCANN